VFLVRRRGGASGKSASLAHVAVFDANFGVVGGARDEERLVDSGMDAGASALTMIQPWSWP
jgi:hypothetical protein